MADKPAVGLAGSEGTLKLTRSDWTGPVNIGSDEMVTINQLADMAMKIAGKQLTKKHIDGPLGVRGGNSDNNLIFKKWETTETTGSHLKY